MNLDLEIRKATWADEESLWGVIQPIIRAGGTYVFAPDSSREKIMGYWLGEDKLTYIAWMNGERVGTFYLKANQPDLGDHICNAGFMVDPKQKGKGIGRFLGQFALNEAKSLGYQAMQYNFVISTNLSAVKLWKSLGFVIIGEIPEAYRHPEQGLVSALLFFKKL
ncbi:GNAT family N-acetyltransferase [Algoriphagus confluentis]|uniref:GNAT family N-acetyltransferase n=1 Tax=Algoriphagus confluentis TaxID=1697556 RepID=A0ABQ6PIU2_9BACT|nr:GNAT family N-acetyltransferase [Algoriphagus confluentis]